ncbi:CoA transferase [Methylosinus sp. Ce-a6]|uniref:CoA transferase n=1 Tax=Methylosinus sp. Ce-a6 TaxID=2172005 RepID=UPI0019154486|nr:CoA transferase [Methylosinus sp. Ce-a6]
MTRMLRPLEDCVVVGSLNDAAPAFAAVASSLLYQAEALGMRYAPAEPASSKTQITFTIETPMSGPVACEVGGWPDPCEGAASENLVQAACGLMSVHGRASGRAQPLGVNYVSTLAAVLALQGAFAAAIGRMRGAPFTRSRLSLAEAGLLGIGQYIAAASTPEKPEKLLPGGSSATERPPFVSADGVIFELETLDAGPWRTFWAEAGVDADSAGKGWNGFLLRYAKAISPLPAALRGTLSAMPYTEIVVRCARAGISICPVRSLDERSLDEDAEPMWREGPWTFRSGLDRSGAPPLTGNGDLPLSGVNVIESCRRIQGPLAGHLLALLGANVLRIEPPGGDPLRGMPPIVDGVSARYDALNRLKAVREIDIKSAQGQAEIKELVRHADVFLHNWAPGKAAELDLDDIDLARANRSLIYAYAGGWGPSAQIDAPGTDFMVQAYSGVADRIAKSSGVYGGSLFTALDVLGGAVTAQGITAALLARRLRGGGVRVDTSLLGAATLLCADDLGSALRRGDAEQLLSQGADAAISGVYATREGRIAIDCVGAEKVARLAEALGLDAAADASEVEDCLPAALSSKSADDWMRFLTKHGAPAAVVVEDLCALHEDERFSRCLGRRSYTQVNSPWRFQ